MCRMKTFLCLVAGASLLALPSSAQTVPPSAAGSPRTAVRNVTADEAEKLLKENKEVVVLDVRTAGEFKAGHIAGAKNIDFNDPEFSKKLATLEKDKSYLVHCGSGGRSSRALKVMEQQKLGAVFHLNKGFKAWEAAGKPVQK